LSIIILVKDQPFKFNLEFIRLIFYGVGTLLNDLKENGTTDSDRDGLTDWTETDREKVTVEPDGAVTLPTYLEYINKYSQNPWTDIDWEVYYGDISDRFGRGLELILDDFHVLPVHSDPTAADGDGDGIMDADEFLWDGVDARYSFIGPLHKDTVETLFPEIRLGGNNQASYPTWLEVKDNDVVLHARMLIEGDGDKVAADCLNMSTILPAEQFENGNIINRLGVTATLKDLLIDGVKSRWNNTYLGSEFDFYKGIKVNFSVELEEITNTNNNERAVVVNLFEGVCGFSHQSAVSWNTNCNRVVSLYTSYCADDSHENKDGSSCDSYQNSLYQPSKYEGTAAHEFGHVFGLYDMYGRANSNDGYEPVSNPEIYFDSNFFGLPQAYDIMKSNGKATANDIEMLILAFIENKWQYFVPQGELQKMSKAIKHHVEFTHGGVEKVFYIWNSSENIFEIKT
jgi:hypothetical protein